MKTFRVILLVENSRGFGRALLRGIAKYSVLQGPWIFYRTPPFYLDLKGQKLKRELAHMKEWNPDGIIMRELWENIDDVLSLGLPTIISTIYKKRKDCSIPQIYVDNLAIGEKAAEHLLERGFKNFAFCGFNDFFWSNERGAGFSKKIREAGYSPHFYKQPRLPRKRLWEKEQVLMIDWLKSLPKPIGLMGCIDERCQDVIEACTSAEIHVPEEIAIIGGDNDELICSLSNPPISSVAVNGINAGYEAASLLHKLMLGEKPKEQTVFVNPTHVVTRRSTDVFAVEDTYVSSALRYIRKNCRKKIQVPDVADHVALSRRTLERHFFSALGRSVSAEIKKVTMEYIARMLIETNFSIAEIAYQLGYYEPNNVSRCFHTVMGMTPRDYRKKYGSAG